MNSKVYKWCAVPQCDNTSIKTPNKLFVFVPQKKTIRYKWLKLAKRDSTAILPSTHLYFCEEHFDLPNDMENYMEYHLMGSVSQVRMKPGCIPTKFQCQTDRKKRTYDGTVRPYIRKKQRKVLIEESDIDLQENSFATTQLVHGETSCISSALQVKTADIKTEDTPKTLDKSTQVHIPHKFRNKGIQTEINLVNQMTSPLRPFHQSVSTSSFTRTFKNLEQLSFWHVLLIFIIILES